MGVIGVNGLIGNADILESDLHPPSHFYLDSMEFPISCGSFLELGQAWQEETEITLRKNIWCSGDNVKRPEHCGRVGLGYDDFHQRWLLIYVAEAIGAPYDLFLCSHLDRNTY